MTFTWRAFLVTLLLFLFCGPAWAQRINEIQLKDGSTIYGEILSASQGTYTIRTESMGTVRISAMNIQQIRFPSRSGESLEVPGSAENLTSSQIHAVQQRMLSDEDLMKSILSLQRDPSMQDALEDPSLLRAVNSGDMAAVLSNPKFIRLMNSPRIQEILREVLQ